jgi:pyruvate formate lyase activating enzyme
MHPARLYKKLKDGKVRCGLCSHFCVIEESRRGLCGVRENLLGELFTLVYGRAAAINIDPVEKKPLYHFMPGSKTFSFGTLGCNLACSFCQNHTLSQPPRQGLPIEGQKVSPEALARAARESGCQSVSYTYSEPTIFFELMQDTARLAKADGLKNIMVSNGFMSPECLEELAPLIDAANIDLKAFNPGFYEDICQARLDPVKKNLVHIRKLGWWLEVTTLLIPGLNDNREELAALTGFIAGELGPDTPWHISRFHPDYKLLDRGPTPARTLEEAWETGKKAGLKYVYVGNLPGNAHNSTHCAGCGKVVIERSGFTVLGGTLGEGACPACGEPLAGRFPG